MLRHASSCSRTLRNSIVVFSAVVLFTLVTAVCLTSISLNSSPSIPGEIKKRRVARSITNRNSSNITKHQKNQATDHSSKDEYPDDLFSLKDKQQGAVILHVLGLTYMFLALATVSDEFFIPTLEVITEEFAVSKDVAGATFMAAGGSAPELFTSFIGVFIANSNVGFGTIVGSAVFNVLFVIGMCAIFSKGVLLLTWWPLFRDCFFYILALTLLIIFFLNDRSGIRSTIYWWESCILMACYFLYVLFMKYNAELEEFVKRVIFPQNRVADESLVLSSRSSPQDTDLYIQKALGYIKDNDKKGQCFRFGVLQLVMWTIDPLRDASAGDLAREMESISNNTRRGSTPGPITASRIPLTVSSQLTLLEVDQENNITLPNSSTPTPQSSFEVPSSYQRELAVESSTDSTPDKDNGYYIQLAEQRTHIEDPSESITELSGSPLDLSWPKSLRERIVYVIRAPILFALHFTLSDVRKPEKRRRYPWTFFVSILWIVVFSYFMVWWAKQISVTIGIDDEIMGLTVLAAGTSIPDLITSVLVARKGYGDMAVSSSVGSNLFDVTIGLPLPWLLWSIINKEAFKVTSSGLFCSTIMLFVMLLTVVISIAVCKWKMSKALGISMLVLYLNFVVLSVLLQKNVIECSI